MTTKPTPAGEAQAEGVKCAECGGWSNSTAELHNAGCSKTAGEAQAERPALPVLDDDDEVAFPNDTGLAVIHADYYWKLRGCEDVCDALGVEGEKRVVAERAPSGESIDSKEFRELVDDCHAYGTEGARAYRALVAHVEARRATAGNAAPVGVIVGNDPVHGWHMKALKPWGEIGAGTLLYASNAAPGDLEAARDAAYPIPDSPHTSVIQRASDNRIAFRFGWEACLASNAGAAPAWIAVENQMPPQDIEVLVFLPNNGDPVIEMDTWGELYESPVSFSSQTICTGEGWASNEFEDITHWMPIPAAPSNPPVGAKENNHA